MSLPLGQRSVDASILRRDCGVKRSQQQAIKRRSSTRGKEEEKKKTSRGKTSPETMPRYGYLAHEKPTRSWRRRWRNC
ncbi:hypothetical protein LZ32DRAFT_598616, partial [Colletotrichum eremochloae]